MGDISYVNSNMRDTCDQCGTSYNHLAGRVWQISEGFLLSLSWEVRATSNLWELRV